MRAIQLSKYGDVANGMGVVELPEPAAPGNGEVLIAVEYVPVNQNDLLVLAGQFPVHPELPSVVGNEGVGTVLQVGPGVENVKVGDRVVPPLYSLTWREKMIVPADGLFALPPEADVQQLAMLRINPASAALLLSEYAELQPGDWVAQNAANSAVGRSVIAIAKSRGLRTVNLVRRAELVGELKAYGADVVVLDDENASEAVRQAAGNATIKLALCGISGAATARLGRLLAPKGKLVSYAVMSGDINVTFNVLDFIFGDISLHGFYEDRREYEPKMPEILSESARLIAEGKLHVPVAAVYPMAQFKEAIAHVQRGGKVLLKIKED
ncbi:zinc-dependent alcohol dehydrogenase family protein [Paraburkholderia sp. GAS348]|uniref:zinc-dependent alcohol dehydrogenase family protein n=1 Tax=Paraburkholderia sp. GAS348 TaxID=3035132 RepID=UPI003D1E48A5